MSGDRVATVPPIGVSTMVELCPGRVFSPLIATSLAGLEMRGKFLASQTPILSCASAHSNTGFFKELICCVALMLSEADVSSLA